MSKQPVHRALSPASCCGNCQRFCAQTEMLTLRPVLTSCQGTWLPLCSVGLPSPPLGSARVQVGGGRSDFLEGPARPGARGPSEAGGTPGAVRPSEGKSEGGGSVGLGGRPVRCSDPALTPVLGSSSFRKATCFHMTQPGPHPCLPLVLGVFSAAPGGSGSLLRFHIPFKSASLTSLSLLLNASVTA